MAEELVNGRGFARIAALDVARLGAEDASWCYWGIGMHLGEPWPQNAKGHLLGTDDRPERFQRVGVMDHWGRTRTRACAPGAT